MKILKVSQNGLNIQGYYTIKDLIYSLDTVKDLATMYIQGNYEGIEAVGDVFFLDLVQVVGLLCRSTKPWSFLLFNAADANDLVPLKLVATDLLSHRSMRGPRIFDYCDEKTKILRGPGFTNLKIEECNEHFHLGNQKLRTLFFLEFLILCNIEVNKEILSLGKSYIIGNKDSYHQLLLHKIKSYEDDLLDIIDCFLPYGNQYYHGWIITFLPLFLDRVADDELRGFLYKLFISFKPKIDYVSLFEEKNKIEYLLSERKWPDWLSLKRIYHILEDLK